MKVKKYTGENIQDVIFQVKADLGPEAVIINKRKFKKGGIFGFFGRTMFEVVAALEDKNVKAQTELEKDQDDDRVEISGYESNKRKVNRENIKKTASDDPENKNAIKEFISDLKFSEANLDSTQKEQDKLNSSQKQASHAEVQPENRFKNELKKFKDDAESKNKAAEKKKSQTAAENTEEDQNLTAEQKLQKKFQNKLGKKKSKNLNNNNQLYNYLLDQGVDSRNLNLFLKKMNNGIDFDSEEEFKEQLKNFFDIYFLDNREINIDSQQKIITFVGPTGVGKTTTMAKIAAHFAVNKNRNVGLITADTYRIAAVEQLQTYSNIIDIPFAVCYSSSKLREMIEGKFRNCDLILIDTPGSSWKDQLQLGRLEDYTDKNIVDEVHLLLSLNTKSSDLKSIVNKFSKLNPDKALLTKLDETNSYGDIINIKENYKLPISYLTCGQDVPEDLETASSEIIYDYLFGDFYE